EVHNFLVTGVGVVVHNSCWRSARKQLDELGVGTNNHRNMDIPHNREKHKIDKPGSTEVAQKYGKNKIEVCFDDLGFPDFNDWVPNVNGTKMEFVINMNGNNLTGSGTGDYGQAFDQMESLLGYRPSALSQIEIPGYEGIQWSLHHHQDGKTMQLVPKMLNSNTPHVGGRTIMKNAREKGIDHWLPSPSEVGNYKKLCN
ncbi:MAG: HNH endonuclease, partial [Phaeodactylibacter xiamenensis]